MPKAPFAVEFPKLPVQLDIKTVQTEAAKSAQRVFDVTVGVTDLAVETVRYYVAGTQERLAGVREGVVGFEPRAFGAQAVRTVNDQVLAVPGRVQEVVDTNVAVATDAYGDLVERGRTLVGRIRRQQSTQEAVAAAETTVTKAKTTKTQGTQAAKKGATSAKKRSAPTRSSAKATSTAAKKTASSASRALTDAAKKVGD